METLNTFRRFMSSAYSYFFPGPVGIASCTLGSDRNPLSVHAFERCQTTSECETGFHLRGPMMKNMMKRPAAQASSASWGVRRLTVSRGGPGARTQGPALRRAASGSHPEPAASASPAGARSQQPQPGRELETSHALPPEFLPEPWFLSVFKRIGRCRPPELLNLG